MYDVTEADHAFAKQEAANQMYNDHYPSDDPDFEKELGARTSILLDFMQRINFHTPPEEHIEEYHFSFSGRPFTLIHAEELAAKPISKGETAIDVKFGKGKYALRILVDGITTKIIKHETK